LTLSNGNIDDFSGGLGDLSSGDVVSSSCEFAPECFIVYFFQ